MLSIVIVISKSEYKAISTSNYGAIQVNWSVFSFSFGNHIGGEFLQCLEMPDSLSAQGRAIAELDHGKKGILKRIKTMRILY
jgi:hypothetical protein